MNEVVFVKQREAESIYGTVCGVDEAGRGPLAGPVCCAAVILRPDCFIDGLDDSKKLSEKKRETLFDEIIEKSVAHSVVLIDNRTIDEINILNATMRGMKQAVESLSAAASHVLIDGNSLPELSVGASAVIKGDSTYACIAAASILAKVTRDRLMLEYAKLYPKYGFEKHKGYGTALHYEMIRKYGITDIHRKTFLKGIV